MKKIIAVGGGQIGGRPGVKIETLEQATDIFTKILLEHNCNDKIEHILL